MKVGDLIRCGKEYGVILEVKEDGWMHDDKMGWLEILWQDNDIEGIPLVDVDEVISEVA